MRDAVVHAWMAASRILRNKHHIGHRVEPWPARLTRHAKIAGLEGPSARRPLIWSPHGSNFLTATSSALLLLAWSRHPRRAHLLAVLRFTADGVSPTCRPKSRLASLCGSTSLEGTKRGCRRRERTATTITEVLNRGHALLARSSNAGVMAMKTISDQSRRRRPLKAGSLLTCPGQPTPGGSPEGI